MSCVLKVSYENRFCHVILLIQNGRTCFGLLLYCYCWLGISASVEVEVLVLMVAEVGEAAF